jgi:Flp pilus assembly protein TadG
MKRLVPKTTLGQELVEYAITLPLFLILVLGIVDLGRVVYYYSAMQNVVREGARYGSIHLEDAGIEATICNLVMSRAIGVDLSCDDVTTTFDFGQGTVTVNVIYPFVPVSQIVTGFFGVNQIDITTSSIMQLEYVPLP